MIGAFLLILLFVFDFPGPRNADTNVTGRNKLPRKALVSVFFSRRGETQSLGKVAACQWLRGFKRQNKQCQGRRGFAKVLQTARHLATTHCQEQFGDDRWNCKYDDAMFQKVFRETAFMYAITASSIMYATARACSEGTLQKCYCAEVPRRPKNGKWRWGGCGDNTKKARSIAKKFLHLPKKNYNTTKILNYNANVGFKSVMRNQKKVCICHGLSASCVIETCWKVQKSFTNIARDLRQRYNSASMVNIGNQPDKTVLASQASSSGALLYLDQSPSFCESTVGRKCRQQDHCATLCCGRGFKHNTVQVEQRCQCRWREEYMNVTCKICKVEEDDFTCK